MEAITVQFESDLIYDRLQTLSAEYAVSTDLLINVAVQRLLDDVDLFRNLRAGNVTFA